MTRDDIAALLPEVYRRSLAPDTPLMIVLTVMERFLTPVEQAIAALPGALDADTAPPGFVPLLAAWMDLERLTPADRLFGARGQAALAGWPAGIDQLRTLVRAAPELSRWRGTAQGLTRFLETATGQVGFLVQDRLPGTRPFHIRVTAPAAALSCRALIERIVAEEAPAACTTEIRFLAAGQPSGAPG